jgi:hypothetical protein
MRELHDSDSLFPVLVIAAAFMIAKVLSWIGLLNNNTYGRVSLTLAISVGALYAISFEFQRSIGGPGLEPFFRLVIGSFVAVVLWVFILVGVGAALPHERDREQSDRQPPHGLPDVRNNASPENPHHAPLESRSPPRIEVKSASETRIRDLHRYCGHCRVLAYPRRRFLILQQCPNCHRFFP